MILLLRRLLLTFFLLSCAAVPARAAEWAVVIVSSERSVSYQEAADAVLEELVRGNVARRDVHQMTAAEWRAEGGQGARLFIALGVEAAGVLARSDARAPVLCALLPRASFERVLRDSGRRVSSQFTALYLNQPLTRQLDLARLALPQVRRVGVLLGSESASQQSQLEEAAGMRNLKLVSERVQPQEPVFSDLKKILADADLLLALADPQIYNSSTIQNILLTSFRAQVPMLAFSPAYVRAGALLAVYSTPTQIGQQAGAMARGFFQGRALGLPQYPQDFSISVNEHVARSLGLNLEPQALADRLRRLERGP
jgi:putative tryptophan/tyrosine transport system substrate-binding protein